jgi:hypothetical protein
MDWVHRSYNSKDKTNHNIVNIEWGGIILNKTYDEILVDKETDYITKRLAPIFIEFIEKTMKDLAENENSIKWLPKPNNFCKICQLSHEAEEFMSSVLDQATSEFMESKEYKQFMMKHHFRQKEENED